jgi:hypothetical protein
MKDIEDRKKPATPVLNSTTTLPRLDCPGTSAQFTMEIEDLKKIKMKEDLTRQMEANN